MRKLDVKLGGGESTDRSYPIFIEKGLLGRVGELMKDAGLGGRVCVVSNPLVGGLYLEEVIESLEAAGFEPIAVEMPDGEKFKNLDEASRIYDALIEEKMERGSAIVALGGGVTGDLAGFVAATYLRGVPYVQIPTTLLSQVDSSIGGKTAVNHPKGKNLIGSFYQPELVCIDPETLKTLEPGELVSGLGEIVKHSVIRDLDYFEFLEANAGAILALDTEMVEAIERSCRIKADVVSADEKEAGVRAILNFGHTFGHAIEAVGGYSTYRHGEAVAMGSVLAADFSARLGHCDPALVGRIGGLLSSFGLPIETPSLNADEIFESMRLDKKVKGSSIRFVLLKEIGEVFVTDVEDGAVRDFLGEVFKG